MKAPKKLIFVVSVDWFFVSHRLPIALEAIKKGYEVTVMAVEEGHQGDFIRSHGIQFIPLPSTRAGMNILRELRVLLLMFLTYLREKPDIVHHVGVKPVTYGSLICKILRIDLVVNALAGMGFLFINSEKSKWAHQLIIQLFKWGFKNPNIQFILQNEDDYALIDGLNVLEKNQLFLIKGSGVDVNKFSFSEEPQTAKLKVLLPARMLWDKGVGEFVNAASILYDNYKDQVDFILCGKVDMGNKAGIPEEQLIAWNKQRVVKWIDYQEDMVKTLHTSHIIVLPSYREGLPKALIEACAVGRPIVTTDVPGCRTIVQDGENGILVPVKNQEALARAIEKLIIDKSLRTTMGRLGREKVEKGFTIEKVVEKTLQIYQKTDLVFNNT